MSLQRNWRSLDRSTVARAPDSYGVFEVGTADGTSLGHGVGVIADELREVLAYGTVPNPTDAHGDPAQVRWVEAQSRDHAHRIADDRF
ncbi:MAG: hypothetical protein ABEI75_05050 [Halobaculum sp.]